MNFVFTLFENPLNRKYIKDFQLLNIDINICDRNSVLVMNAKVKLKWMRGVLNGWDTESFCRERYSLWANVLCDLLSGTTSPLSVVSFTICMSFYSPPSHTKCWVCAFIRKVCQSWRDLLRQRNTFFDGDNRWCTDSLCLFCPYRWFTTCRTRAVFWSAPSKVS